MLECAGTFLFWYHFKPFTDMPNTDWIIDYLVPGLGVLINNIMYITPYLAVLEARKHKKLGKLNAVPFAMLTVSQTGWTIYSYLLRDCFIFFSSCFGLVLGLLMCFTSIHLLERAHHSPAEEKERLTVEGFLIGGITYFIFAVFVTSIILGPSYASTNTKIIGGSAAGCSLTYYALPLSHMVEIVKNKDSSSLNAPTIFCNLLNCILWFVYGLIALEAVAVWLPNGIGILISISELFLCLIFPSKHKAIDDSDDSQKSSQATSSKLHSVDADSDEASGSRRPLQITTDERMV